MNARIRIVTFLLCIAAAFGAASLTGPSSAAAPPLSGIQESASSSMIPTTLGSSFFRSTRVNAAGVEQTEWLGSIVIWVLLLGSAAGIALIIHLLLRNTRATMLPMDVVRDVRSFLETGEREQAMHLTENDESFFSAIAHAGLRRADDGHAAMIQSLALSAEELTTERLRRVEYLNVLGQVSPMLGLFGTVYGMILAFQAIVATGGQADPVMLAGGIGTALVTTFWGLVVAIPALSGYALLRNRIDALTMEAAIEAEDLLTQLARHSKEGRS